MIDVQRPSIFLGEMKPDDPICLCFHVTRRKVENFIRVEKPRRASQLSECFGAGTGCGWCRPYLERVLEAENSKIKTIEQLSNSEVSALDQISTADYARQRSQYVREGGGTPPPGATPLDPESE